MCEIRGSGREDSNKSKEAELGIQGISDTSGAPFDQQAQRRWSFHLPATLYNLDQRKEELLKLIFKITLAALFLILLTVTILQVCF